MEKIFEIENRKIGIRFPPLIIPEIGINHNGDFNKAKKMIFDAKKAGAECVKFQCHIINEEMIENNVVPPNAKESIWKMMERCSLTKNEEFRLKKITEKLGMIYLNTPFSKAAVDRLEDLEISAYKIGSGECNNLPLIDYIASKNKPILLSTGMNSLNDIKKTIKILKKHRSNFGLMHVTSQYPTPYKNVRLKTLVNIKNKFPEQIIGLSDHSIGNYTSFAAISLGASVIEKHFTSKKNWKGSDIPISITPNELGDLIKGSKAIWDSMGEKKNVLSEELDVAKFAFSSVVSIREIKKGEKFSKHNIWVKRPGTGKIKAYNFKNILNKYAKKEIKNNTQIEWNMIE